MPNSTEKTPRKTTRAKSPTGTAKPRAKTTKMASATPEITAAAPAESTSSAATTTRVPTRDEIAQRAHELYVKSGFVAGRDLEFWLEAERQLRSGK